MRKILLSVGAIIFGASLLTLANGAVSTFLTVEMAKTGVPPALVGLVITGHAIGFILGCFIAGRAIRMVGHIRVFAAFAAAAAIATMAYTMSEVWWLWLVLRMIVGFCSAGLFTVAESWMSDRTPKEQRGSALSIYMISNKLAFASGQGLLILNETYGFVVLLVMSALYSFALIPVAMTRSTGPNIPQVSTLHFKTVYRIAPAGLVGAVAVGLMTSAVLGVTPVYGAALTLSTEMIALLVAALQIGSLFFQWPLGWMSDRMDRRVIIVGATLAVVAISAVLAFSGPLPQPVLIGLFALWGGVGLSIYGICVAHANDFAPPGTTVALSSSLLLAWATGSIIGPTVSSLLIQLMGPGGLFVFTGTVALSLAVFVLYRMTRRAARPVEERDVFINIPATSPAMGQLARGDQIGTGEPAPKP